MLLELLFERIVFIFVDTYSVSEFLSLFHHFSIDLIFSEVSANLINKTKIFTFFD